MMRKCTILQAPDTSLIPETIKFTTLAPQSIALKIILNVQESQTGIIKSSYKPSEMWLAPILLVIWNNPQIRTLIKSTKNLLFNVQPPVTSRTREPSNKSLI